MIDTLEAYTPYIKIVHIVAMIAWMAGLLYLPRLFVYHANLTVDDNAYSLFATMERRLLNVIMTPAMIVVWLSGLMLVALNLDFHVWLFLKVACVIGLSWYHILLGQWRQVFADQGLPPHSALFFRFINEVPTVLMIIIVTLVVLKPF